MTAEAKIKASSTGLEATARRFRDVGTASKKAGRAGARAGAMMSRGWAGAKGAIGGVGAALGGLSVLAGVKKVLSFDDVLGQIQAESGMTTTQMMKLRQEMIKSSVAHGVNKDKVSQAISVFQGFGGIVDKGRVILGALTKRSKATGAEMSDLATITSVMMTTMEMSPKGALKALDQLNQQTIAGTITLEKLAAVLPEVLSSGTAYGFKGARAVQQLGTALQVAGTTSGGKAEIARTQVKALLRDLTKNAPKIKKLLNVDVFDKKGQMKNIDVVMAAILKKTKGKMVGKRGLGAIFTADSTNLAAAYGNAFDQTGKYKKEGVVSKVSNSTQGDSSKALDEQYKRRTQGIAKQAEQVKRGMAKADAALQTHGKRLMAWVASNPELAAALGLGGVVAVKAGPALLKGLLSRGASGGGGGGAAGLMGAATVQRVFVVNMGVGGMGGVGGAATGTAGALSKLGAAAGHLALAYVGAKVITEGIGQNLLQIQRKASEARVAQHARGVGQTTLVRMAGQFGALNKQGVGSLTIGGKKQALTQELAMERLRAQATRDGVSESDWKSLAPVLQQLIAALKTRAQVEAKGGAPPTAKVQVGRGRGIS